MIAFFIIFCIVCIIIILLSYTIADFTYYMGYDRAMDVVLNEWEKDMDIVAEHTGEPDNDWETRMIRIDKCSEISESLLKESHNIQLNIVLKEWWNGRKRSKRDNTKPPVQANIEHEATN